MLPRLQYMDSCAISDALDFLGLPGSTNGILPLWPCERIVGRALTVQVDNKKAAGETQHMITPAVEKADSDTVLVIANAGDKSISCWGGIIAHAAIIKGIRGVVIDGAGRDLDENRELRFPVFGRSAVHVSARNRLVQTDFDCDVEFAGVKVSSGDYVVADASGTVFIGQDRIADVLDIAERVKKREAAMIEAVRSGRSVVEVMHDRQFAKIMERGGE
ncbi:RraA family protein [Rhodoligotrophos defluvii]|uniref:RraA family protein n=1 Tax=Rhodoligotrophos defluvii TaxID=2561934 RepID=UPI0010C98689|nr:RraA family protein [Rhodoligotrophos defluvii]